MEHFQSLNQNLNTSNYPGDDHQEESGWTAYFEDLSNSKDEDDQSFSSSTEIGSPSMVSDAASFSAWKSSQPNNSNNHPQLVTDHSSFGALSPNNIPIRRLKFKKTRTSGIVSLDDSLEDSASSPVNSPKVGVQTHS